MEEDRAICRVCRGASYINQPLYHPCKCSGSIKYIHQECLIQWLSHSKKKYCELCEYHFKFTPIYRDDMPIRIPLAALLQRSLSHFIKSLIIFARSILVVLVWFILLPILTLWTWKFYFWSGKNIGFTLSHYESGKLLFSLKYTYSSSKEFLSDCFEGQIIMAVVVIVFVAAYLFREWVIKNTTHIVQQNAARLDTSNGEQNQGLNSPMNENESPRDRLNARLIELRRDLERRRVQPLDTEEMEYYDNPYIANRTIGSPAVLGYYTNNGSQAPTDDIDLDDFNNIYTSSGTHSPFISWRDYQQDTKSNNLNDENLSTEEGQNDYFLHESSKTVSYTKSAENKNTGLQNQIGNKKVVETKKNTVENMDFGITKSTHLNHASNSNVQIATGTNNIRNENTSVELRGNANLNNEANGNINMNTLNNNAGQEAPFDFTEDINGILEAIGMRGSLGVLLKNSALMTLMINLCLCVTVWIPYVIGRSVILIHLPSVFDQLISLLKLCFDPFMDFFLLFVLKPVLAYVIELYKTILPNSVLTAIKATHNSIFSNLYFIFRSIHIALLDPASGNTLSQLISDTTNNIINSDWTLIKDNAVSISCVIFKRWRECAVGQSSFDRTVCTCVGYVVLISVGSFYLSRNKSSRPGSTNEILRQQAVFIKVLFCIFLELVILPTICGFLLDISTFPLFTQWTVKGRFHFVLLNPYSSVFLHWFVGTGFILQFSIFISLVREVVRPGVIYFMRDPNGPRFHPVQDMVDQPILILLRELIGNIGIYFMLIMVGMGLVTLLVSQFGGIYPIVWQFNMPISTVPIDLVAIHFLLSPLMSYIVPREFFKKNVITWWHIVSRQLRLSSFMFGGRYPEEEGVFVYESWKIWIKSCFTTTDVVFKKEGGLARVPGYDNVPLIVPRRRMIVPIHSVTLQPLDELEQRKNHPAVSERGCEDTDTTVVYIPPFFKIRIIIFLFLIWTTASLLVCSISVVPLKLGRNLFSKFQLVYENQIHDLYSFGLGAFTMIVLSTLLNTIIQKYNIVEKDRGKINWALVKKYLIGKIEKIVKFFYLFSIFGFVIPFLVGMAVDLYLFVPLKVLNYRQNTIDLYLTINWAMGVVVFGVFYGVIYFLPNDNHMKEKILQLTWRNFDNLNPWHISKSIIAPIVLILMLFTSVPYVFGFLLIRYYYTYSPSTNILVIVYSYLTLFSLVCLISSIIVFNHLLKMYILYIRNDIYLVGKRLHNFNE